VSGTGEGGAYLAGYVPSRDIDTVNTNAVDSDAVFQNGANLNVKAHLGGVTLTAITGYEDFRDITFNDADYTPLEISRQWAWAKSYQISQELRLSSQGEHLTWVAGAFAFYEDIKRHFTTAKLPGVDQAAPGPSNFAFTSFDHATKSFAGFASVTYLLNEIFSATAGLRLTSETRSLAFSRVATAPGAEAAFSNISRWWRPGSVSTPLTSGFDANPEKTWTNLTWDVTPQARLAKNALVYVRYAHGVKSGGYNTAATSAAALNVVEPEKLDDYELGAKTSWWSGRITANASAFRYQYRDIQVNVVGPLPPTNTAISYLQNVGAGRVNGGELELDTLPLRDLRLGGSLGLLDTKFTDFQVLNGGANYNGNQFVRSPHVSSLLRGEYTLPVTSQGAHVVFAADWRYTSKQYHFATNQSDPLLTTGRLHIVNARLALADRDDKVILSVYANNLADVHYRAHSLPGATNATGDIAIWGDPRTVGASLLVRWW
jgi:iron complex outermembrane receptor protein